MTDIEWVAVAGGVGPLGVVVDASAASPSTAAPAHAVSLRSFQLSRTPVTNAQYAAFVTATGHAAPAHWEGPRPPAILADHPVTYVDWHDATAFSAWAGARLPSEAEWERAARGTDARTYPWGEHAPDPLRANCDGWYWTTTPVGALPAGAGPGGALDLAGNVWEWTASLHRPYPYDADDGREDQDRPGPRVLRGGSYLHPAAEMRTSARDGMYPSARDEYIGFRLATDDPSTGRPLPGLEWVAVLGTTATMGDADDPPMPERLVSRPALGCGVQQVMLAPFDIARTPVTNAQYAAFVTATGHAAPAHWEGPRPPARLADHPVTYVDWHDATAFCAWADARLPSEAEWERAARGTDARTYPSGEHAPDRTRAWFGDLTGGSRTAPVHARADGASACGALDLAGNVWEWTASLHRPYPYDADDGREDPTLAGRRVLRGGSFRTTAAQSLQAAFRSLSHPTRRRDHIGFRPLRARAQD